MTPATKRAIQKYKRKSIIRFTLELNRNTDRDIIAWLDAASNMTGAIKAAIRWKIAEDTRGAEAGDELPEYDENGDYTGRYII